jgi:hypothetical protein
MNRVVVTARQSPNFETFKELRNRFKGINSASLCSLAGRYDNPIPTRFLAPIDCLKIPAQATQAGGIDSLEAILGLLKSLKIPACISLAETPQPPPPFRIWAHVRGRYWSMVSQDRHITL